MEKQWIVFVILVIYCFNMGKKWVEIQYVINISTILNYHELFFNMDLILIIYGKTMNNFSNIGYLLF